jgi:hypothetical protein
MPFLSLLSPRRTPVEVDPHGLVVDPVLCRPTNVAEARWRMYEERREIVEEASVSLPTVLPAWDSTAPMTAAVLHKFRRVSAKQFTTDPYPYRSPDDSPACYFSQFHDTDGVRNHDKVVTFLKVDGMRRVITAEDLLAEQPQNVVGSELFLAGLSGSPAFFRMPLARALYRGRAPSVRVVVFQGDRPMVQFQPEYPGYPGS